MDNSVYVKAEISNSTVIFTVCSNFPLLDDCLLSDSDHIVREFVATNYFTAIKLDNPFLK